ncbi:MAG: hypothetical protein NC180_01810 [Muribaculaceae bacterium]|nr:hypothetical protein [Roseburia sp.]MCM1430684.1 hypothetical protein [Muribaculaceae bacterium]MCM1491951.1 hypothetical protein [Muribaculaceae bacterium]
MTTFGFIVWFFIIMAIIMMGANRTGKKDKKQRPQSVPPQNRAQSMPLQNRAQGSQGRTMTDADRARLEEFRRKKEGQQSIVERAKANSQRYAKKDETLESMEREHGHSERVSPAWEQPLMHEEESFLGSVEDLMIKGYDGNLSFERDFIGEAQDFLMSMKLPG